MQVRNILIGVSLSALTTTVAMAKAKKEPNCEVNGKKEHVRDEKQCTKKKGTWMGAGTAAAPAGGAMAPAGGETPAASTAPAATTTAPAGGAEAK